MARWTLMVLVVVLLLPCDAARVQGPRLLTAQDLPADVRALTDETWRQFLDVFPAKRSCLGDVELLLVSEVDGGAAEYVRSERLIRIEIPSSPSRYPESLVHELGHHLEEVCDVEPEIGSAFRAAIGETEDADWEGAGRWKDRPTEHFAETVVELVLGERPTHGDLIELDRVTVELVEYWARQPPSTGR